MKLVRDCTLAVSRQGAEPPKVRSELDIARRLAFVLELIARGEVKAKIPKGAPLLDGLEVRCVAACSERPWPDSVIGGRVYVFCQVFAA